MTINTSLSADQSVFNVVLSGRVDINQSLQMQDCVSTLSDAVDVVRIDLKQVTYLDASIFATLLLLNENNKQDGFSMELVNCTRDFARRFSLSGMDRFIKVRMSDDAINEMASEGQLSDINNSSAEQ